MSNSTTLRTKTIAALNARAEEIGMKAEELIQLAEDFIDGFCETKENEARDFILQLKVTPPATKEEETTETADEQSTETAETAEATTEAPAEDTTDVAETTETPAEEKTKKKPRTLEDILRDAEILEIGVENVGKFCGDLAAAYKAAHPKCWLNRKVELPEDLQKTLGGDVTVLRYVKDKCNEAMYRGEAALGRTIFLLSAKEENKRFGGLRSLHMGFNQAVFLKDAANQIGEYLKSLMADREPSNGLPILEGVEFPTEAPKAVKTAKKQKSDKEVAEAAQTTKTQDVAETPAAEAAEKPVAIPTKPAKKLDTHKVINRLGDVRSFLFLADKLRKAGIDPEALLEKEDGVKAMIQNVVKAMGQI